MTASSIVSAQTSTALVDHIRLIDDIESGLSVEDVDLASESLGLRIDDLAHYGVIAQRTLTHSKQNGKFSAVQSDRISRFFRVYQNAVKTFGTDDKTKTWLMRPTRVLDNRSPCELINTDEGTRLVEQLLHRISHGLGA